MKERDTKRMAKKGEGQGIRGEGGQKAERSLRSPGVMSPAFSASSIMLLPIRSFTLLQGSILSNLSRMVAWQSTARRFSLICNMELSKFKNSSRREEHLLQADRYLIGYNKILFAVTNHGGAANDIDDRLSDFRASHRGSAGSDGVAISVRRDINHAQTLECNGYMT